MAVIIRPKFNASQIARMIADKRLRIMNTIISGLRFIGETFVTNARDNHVYMNQTGNLESSIGYVLYHNGALISNAFPGDKPEGVSKARELADEVAANYPTGFVLVCVAGMQYAASVESKGYDVITNSSITAVQDIRDLVKRLKDKVKQMRA